MSYPPQQPPYGGPPPGHGYYYPPPPQQPYPPQPGFHGGPPPAHGYSPYHSPSPSGQYNYPPPPPPPHPQSPHGSYYGGPPPQGYPHPSSPYGHQPYPPPPAPGAYPPQGLPQGPPSHPSPGYNFGHLAPGDYRPQAEQLRKAMKGLGTDEKALINVLARLDPMQVAAVRVAYSSHINRDLHKDVKSEVSGYFRQALLAIIDGPLFHDATLVHDAVDGAGTKEWLLNDVLLGRSNADINAIKFAYEQRFRRSLAKDVEDDLSFKTQTLFQAVLSATRHEEWYAGRPGEAEAEARTIHDSTSARMVNDVVEVCGIFARSSDTELRAINHAFQTRYYTSLADHITKNFSGHMQDALLRMLLTATDPAMRDAVALEDCMKGAGTKDEKLVVRVVRLHWNRAHLHQVKGAYRVKYGEDLVRRVRGETSGDYQRLMVAMLE